MKGKKVFVGLSGGVDSAVSAALLKKQGYEVTGVFIKIQIPGYPCPAKEDRLEAMRVAAHLGIGFTEVDLSAEYAQEVFRPSVAEFKAGHTPNPDTLCNEKIKFGIFFDYCRAQGAEYVATGHYAQVLADGLSVSADQNKDQTYFLWAVPETALRHTLFPVGSLTKLQVRRHARRFGLPNAARKDSQGLCFLGPIGIKEMLAREIPQKPGKVLDENGNSIGTHQGAALYTLGERHGFTLNPGTPHTKPHFVVAKDISANTITVSPERVPRQMRRTVLELAHTNWIGSGVEGAVEARFRYRQPLIPATVQRGQGQTTVTLGEPHLVAEGQSLVLYLPAQAGRGQRCLGGGVIIKATLAP